MRAIARTVVTLALAGWLVACSTAPPSGDARNARVEPARATVLFGLVLPDFALDICQGLIEKRALP